MPEDTSKRDRIVRTNKWTAIAFYGLETDGTQLLEFEVDSQSNQVTVMHSSHARYGIDFVEADEPRQSLSATTAEGTHGEGDAGIDELFQTPATQLTQPDDRPTWQRVSKPDGSAFASKQDWRQSGSPES